MLIWDIIRDWFVMNVWGGITSSDDYFSCRVGSLLTQENSIQPGYGTGDYFVPISGYDDAMDTVIGLSLGDWLSTTSTIIVLCAVCVALYFLVRYFFRMFAGLIAGR